MLVLRDTLPGGRVRPEGETMSKNRKNADTYRFNGVWGMKSVGIAELETLIQRFQRKLADPNDPDDEKWTARWLGRFRRELEKKEGAREEKQGEDVKCRREASRSPRTPDASHTPLQ